MLLRLQFLLLLLCAASFSCLAQISVEDAKQLGNVARFDGEQQVLFKLLAKNVRYPINAIRGDKIGTVVGVIKISRNGDIVETGTLNTADKLFEDEFKRVARLTEGKWVASNDTAEFFYAVIPFHFMFTGSGYGLDETHKPSYFQETVMITVTGKPSGRKSTYIELERGHLEKVNTGIEAGKYQESIEALLELINLQPYHPGFYEPLVMLYKETGQANQEAYYSALLEQLAK